MSADSEDAREDSLERSSGHLGFWRDWCGTFEFYGRGESVYRAHISNPLDDEGQRRNGKWICRWHYWPDVLKELLEQPRSLWLDNELLRKQVDDFEDEFYGRLLHPSAAGGWAGQHLKAVVTPRGFFERSLVSLFGGWLLYADAHQNAYRSGIGSDGVLGECWAQIGAGLRGLLNGERGRLDGGTLDRLVNEALAESGFDPKRL